MEKMIVNIKLLPHAPAGQLERAHETDAGFDIRSAADILIKPISCLKTQQEEIVFSNGDRHQRFIYEKQLIPTGIIIASEDLAYFWIVPRSGFSTNYLMGIRNVPGLIDYDYRGEIFVSAVACAGPIPITRGERIAQLVPVLQIDVKFDFVDKITHQTLRGSGGFGSTGIE